MTKINVNSFVKEFYDSFIHIRGVPVTLLSLLLGLLFFYYSSNSSTIELKVALPIIVLLILIIITLFDLSLKLYEKALKEFPKVLQAHKPPSIYTAAIAILLLEESEIFGTESLVSIYFQEDKYEVLIGIGFVITRQDNGLIQVLVNKNVEEAYLDVWEKVSKNDASILPRLLVKPSMPKFYSEGEVP